MPLNNDVLSLNRLKIYFLTFSAFILGFALPVSIALVNVAYGLVIISILVNRDFSHAVALVKRPLFYLPLIMFLFMLASLFYADNELGKAILSKYRKLLYIFPIALFFLQDRRLALVAVKGFASANVLVLALSMLAWLGWFNVLDIPQDNPTVFHLQITQNFFLAISCLIWLVMAFKTSGWKRVAFGVLLALGVFNVFFLVGGRTGQLAIITGLGVWLWLILSGKQRIGLVISAIVCIAIAGLVPNKVRDRLILGGHEIQRCVGVLDFNQVTPEACNSSMGLRTEFAYRATQLIKRSPIIGVGVGGFDFDVARDGNRHVNAHNEYLMQTLQSGFIGLGLFLLWVFFMYRAALSLPGMTGAFCIAIITAYMAGCAFNSFILDAYEGQLFMMFVAYLAAETARRYGAESKAS